MPPPAKKRLCERLSAQQRSKQNRELAAMMAKATQLAQQDQVFAECLPALFQGQIHWNELTAGTLSLTCYSAGIATRFRMQQDQILRNLRQRLSGADIQRLEIKIRPAQKASAPAQKSMHLSKENAQLLLEEAGRTLDQKLKAVLTRLAMHASQ